MQRKITLLVKNVSSQKCEICISGIATLRKHSLPTQRKRREGKRACVYNNNNNFKRTPQTINEKENPWGYRLGTVSGKTICHWGFKPGSRVHQPHTCPNRFSYEQTSTTCLGKITPTHTSARQCCMQKHTNI